MGVERPVVRWNHESGPKPSQMDAVAEEAPLAVHLDGVAIATVLRTPGNDTELAIGFCIAEGLLVPGESLAECTESHGQVRLRSRRPGRTPRPTEARRFPANSACGACGRPPGSPLAAEGRYAHAKHFTALCPEALVRLPDRLRTEQPDFAATGGIHAAGLWDPDDDTLRVREDVGRHNAVDKLIGQAFLENRLPLSRHVLISSGRAGFEIVQKAVVAGIPVVAAIGAPSSMAIDLARETDTTLIGFLRPARFNVLSGAWRLFPEHDVDD